MKPPAAARPETASSFALSKYTLRSRLPSRALRCSAGYHQAALLLTALHFPTSFDGKEKYISIEEKAAALFYHAAKDHLFENGNKRTAVILTMIFLFINNKWLTMSPEEMYDLSLNVASSSSSDSAKSYDIILDAFKESIVEYSHA